MTTGCATNIVHLGDCLDILPTLPDGSVDAVVTDPPYGLSDLAPDRLTGVIARWAAGERDYCPDAKGFMSKAWDGFVPPPAVWDECFRVLKPGGHMLVFAGTRTVDLMGLSLRLAGFEVRDMLGWIYGSGFPKSLDVGKALDKAAGAEREVIGEGRSGAAFKLGGTNPRPWHEHAGTFDITAPATDEARRWDGWGTALKPAIEPILLCRRPLDGTVAHNVQTHGVGALHIDACRVAVDSDDPLRTATYVGSNPGSAGHTMGDGWAKQGQNVPMWSGKGRWPANIALDEHTAALLDAQAPHTGAAAPASGPSRTGGTSKGVAYGARSGTDDAPAFHGDKGGASRFFPVFKYQAKAPKAERPSAVVDGRTIEHSTVKPLDLIRWCIRLITPADGVVLDPFAGSGTTIEACLLENMRYIGIEREPDYHPLIAARIARVTTTPEGEDEWTLFAEVPA